jgi:hypothetical protein
MSTYGSGTKISPPVDKFEFRLLSCLGFGGGTEADIDDDETMMRCLEQRNE